VGSKERKGELCVLKTGGGKGIAFLGKDERGGV